MLQAVITDPLHLQPRFADVIYRVETKTLSFLNEKRAGHKPFGSVLCVAQKEVAA